MSREASPDALARHFPSGPWWQPDGHYAGHCGCGETYEGTTHADAVNAWAVHAYADRVRTTAGEDDGLIARLRYILDSTVSAQERVARRAHLTSHDLRRCIAALSVPTPSAGEREVMQHNQIATDAAERMREALDAIKQEAMNGKLGGLRERIVRLTQQAAAFSTAVPANVEWLFDEAARLRARKAITDRYYAGGKLVQMTPVKPAELVDLVIAALAIPGDSA